MMGMGTCPDCGVTLPEFRGREKAEASTEEMDKGEMYSPAFKCEEKGHTGIRIFKDGRKLCLQCGEPWYHIGEITE